jgi:GNAT superfamily N-acetyltransferase
MTRQTGTTMNTFKIITVSDFTSIKEFHQLPFEIYKNDENWVPHPKQDVELVFDKKKNKYFRHGKCERWILVNKGNKVVGRIAAFVDKKRAFTFNQPTGGIGFFECIDNQTAANMLFDTGKSWLEKEGMEAMDGPINFGVNINYWGLLLDNFEFPSYYGQNYNPQYYKALIENYGFQVYYYQLINYRKIKDPFPEKYQLKAEAILNDSAFHFESFRIKQLKKYAEDFKVIYNSAWVTHDNFKAMSSDLAFSLFNKMKRVIDESLICFVYHKNKPVGFCLTIPDLNPIFKHVYGNLNFYGKLKFLWHKTFLKLTRINGIAIGVIPEFQKKGIEAAIFLDLDNKIRLNNSGYKDIVVTWVADYNPKMQHIFDELGFKPVSKMATYRKLFDPNEVFERRSIIMK